MSDQLINRGVSVTLAKSVKDRFFTTTEEVVVTGLRVVFSVVKTIGSKANTCTATFYNFAERTRALLQTRPLSLRLEAGYDGQLARLFTGDVTWADSQLTGVDWMSKVTVGDGHRALNYAHVSRSFKGGVDARTLMNEITGSMGLKVPTSIADAKEMAGQFLNGVTVHGPAAGELDRLLHPKGLRWSIQDGSLQVLRDSDTRADGVVLVSKSNGMIGTPDYGAPTAAGKPPVLKVSMLMYPGLTPGGRIQMASRSVHGIFRIEKVTHTGDTHGQDWKSDIEARPL